MNFLKFETVFKVRVVYKSGYTHDVECTKFNIKDGSTFHWEGVHPEHKPLMFGADDVVAVWCMGTKKRIALK